MLSYFYLRNKLIFHYSFLLEEGGGGVVKSFFLLFNVFPFRLFFFVSRSIHAWQNGRMIEFTTKSTQNPRLNHDVS